MRPTALASVLVALLVVSGAAVAQSGPAPGYPTAVDYAQAYAESQADNASRDPGQYAESKASPDAVAAEAAHAAYIACWALDDQGVEQDACDPFYTPRGEAQPEQPVEPMPEAESAMNATDTFVHNVTDEVENITSDPSQAPGAIKRLAGATATFLGAIGGAVLGLADGLVGAIQDLLGLVGGLGLGIQELGLGVSGALIDGIAGTLDGLALGSQATTEALATVGGLLADGFIAVGQGIAGGAGATAELVGTIGAGIATAGGKVFAAIGTAAGAVGDAIVSAGKAVAGAIADVAGAIKDAVVGLFDGDAKAPVETSDLPDAQLPDADGLLGGVTELLE